MANGEGAIGHLLEALPKGTNFSPYHALSYLSVYGKIFSTGGDCFSKEDRACVCENLKLLKFQKAVV